MSISESISLVALIVSIVALYYAAIKESHLVRLIIRRSDNVYKTYLTIQNHSQFPIEISSVGYITSDEEIIWLTGFNDAYSGKPASLPTRVLERSTFEGSITDSYTNEFRTDRFGLLVQLTCGRTYFRNSSLAKNVALKFVLLSILSKMSAGRIGFDKSYHHAKKYGD
jgi:hypothetical protein